MLDAIQDVQGRGKGGMTPEQQQQFDEAVAVLEADGGVQVGTWDARQASCALRSYSTAAACLFSMPACSARLLVATRCC